MNSKPSRIDTGIGVSFIASAVIHLAVFLLWVWWGQLYSPQMAIQETYYVDVVNLPVVDPLSGSSAQKPGDAESAPTPAQAPPMVEPSPSRPAPKVGTKFIKPAAPQESAESESAFAERMAKIERNSENRREEAVLEKLRSKVKAGGSPKTGAPGADGTESGSRYGDFVKSRLEDALKVTSYSTTRNPEVAVRLTISGDGKLLRMKIERSSGDAAFELAVRRAIDLASDKFTAPPNHAVFENGFLFKPKGISNGVSR
ncbi:MAG: cell envelope integrity protein TolA [Geobacteraceae bacterium]|nr:cell envelope integrity protein TolA [Geobacteraceae bacterium]NTW81551.1 cell envelope integrity protein TolA [Geobacteraceae bacterium]